MATQDASAAAAPRVRHIWAARSGPLAMLLIFGASLALLGGSLLSVLRDGRNSEIPMALAYAFWTLLVARIIVVHVVSVGPEYVVVREPLRSHRIQWDEITAFTASPHRGVLRRRFLALTVELVDGGRLVLSELLDKPDGHRLAGVADRLNALRPAARI